MIFGEDYDFFIFFYSFLLSLSTVRRRHLRDLWGAGDERRGEEAKGQKRSTTYYCCVSAFLQAIRSYSDSVQSALTTDRL